MFDHRTWASMLLALGVCNALVGFSVLLARDRVWVPFTRWLGSLSEDRLSVLFGLLARGQIIIGLVLLVAAIVIVRRSIGRAGATSTFKRR